MSVHVESEVPSIQPLLPGYPKTKINLDKRKGTAVSISHGRPPRRCNKGKKKGYEAHQARPSRSSPLRFQHPSRPLATRSEQRLHSLPVQFVGLSNCIFEAAIQTIQRQLQFRIGVQPTRHCWTSEVALTIIYCEKRTWRAFTKARLVYGTVRRRGGCGNKRIMEKMSCV